MHHVSDVLLVRRSSEHGAHWLGVLDAAKLTRHDVRDERQIHVVSATDAGPSVCRIDGRDLREFWAVIYLSYPWRFAAELLNEPEHGYIFQERHCAFVACLLEGQAPRIFNRGHIAGGYPTLTSSASLLATLADVGWPIAHAHLSWNATTNTLVNGLPVDFRRMDRLLLCGRFVLTIQTCGKLVFATTIDPELLRRTRAVMKRLDLDWLTLIIDPGSQRPRCYDAAVDVPNIDSQALGALFSDLLET